MNSPRLVSLPLKSSQTIHTLTRMLPHVLYSWVSGPNKTIRHVSFKWDIKCINKNLWKWRSKKWGPVICDCISTKAPFNACLIATHFYLCSKLLSLVQRLWLCLMLNPSMLLESRHVSVVSCLHIITMPFLGTKLFYWLFTFKYLLNFPPQSCKMALFLPWQQKKHSLAEWHALFLMWADSCS